MQRPLKKRAKHRRHHETNCEPKCETVHIIILTLLFIIGLGLKTLQPQIKIRLCDSMSRNSPFLWALSQIDSWANCVTFFALAAEKAKTGLNCDHAS
jgi:hypothetical protein